MVLEMAVSLGDLLDDADEVWSTFFCRGDTRTPDWAWAADA